MKNFTCADQGNRLYPKDTYWQPTVEFFWDDDKYYTILMLGKNLFVYFFLFIYSKNINVINYYYFNFPISNISTGFRQVDA